MNDEVPGSESRTRRPALRVSLEGLTGIFAEEPLSRWRFHSGVLWRGLWCVTDAFRDDEVEYHLGSTSGAFKAAIPDGSRDEVDDAATIAEEMSLNYLVNRARDVASVDSGGRELAKLGQLQRLAIHGVDPELSWARVGFGRDPAVKCEVKGRIVSLTSSAWDDRVPSGLAITQPLQSVIRRIRAAADEGIVRHLASAPEVQRLGKASYDQEAVVKSLLYDSDSRVNYLITFRGEDVGFAHVEFTEDENGRFGWPCMVVTKPDLQGQGLGTRVMAALCHEAVVRKAVPHLPLSQDAEVVERIAVRLGFEYGGIRGGIERDASVPYYQPPADE